MNGYKGENRRLPENGDGRRDYDQCKYCPEHSGHKVTMEYLEKEQKEVKKEIGEVKQDIKGMQKTMLTTAVTGVIAMLALVANLIKMMLDGP